MGQPEKSHTDDNNKVSNGGKMKESPETARTGQQRQMVQARIKYSSAKESRPF